MLNVTKLSSYFLTTCCHLELLLPFFSVKQTTRGTLCKTQSLCAGVGGLSYCKSGHLRVHVRVVIQTLLSRYVSALTTPARLSPVEFHYPPLPPQVPTFQITSPNTSHALSLPPAAAAYHRDDDQPLLRCPDVRRVTQFIFIIVDLLLLDGDVWTDLKINYKARLHEETTVKTYGIPPAEVPLSNRLLYNFMQVISIGNINYLKTAFLKTGLNEEEYPPSHQTKNDYKIPLSNHTKRRSQ